MSSCQQDRGPIGIAYALRLLANLIGEPMDADLDTLNSPKWPKTMFFKNYALLVVFDAYLRPHKVNFQFLVRVRVNYAPHYARAPHVIT